VSEPIAKRPARICSEPGCGRPHRARGLCGSHYNQQHAPNRHAKRDIVCLECGQPHTTTRPDGAFCSEACHGLNTRRLNGNLVRHLWTFQPAKPDAWRTCAHCGSSFALPWITSFCSQHCEAAHYAPRSFSRWISNEERVRIYERDRWRCGTCGLQVPHRWETGSELRPTLDHVIPRSQGGTDDAANLRIAHLICNSRRGAVGGGEQLALIG
jgi:hypothetical protein